jgi:hypothetical protein
MSTGFQRNLENWNMYFKRTPNFEVQPACLAAMLHASNGSMRRGHGLHSCDPGFEACAHCSVQPPAASVIQIWLFAGPAHQRGKLDQQQLGFLKGRSQLSGKYIRPVRQSQMHNQ